MQCIASARTAAQLFPTLSPTFTAEAAAICASRACAPFRSSGTRAVSGMFFQYFFGISFSIAPTFTRAGLKMEA